MRLKEIDRSVSTRKERPFFRLMLLSGVFIARGLPAISKYQYQFYEDAFFFDFKNNRLSNKLVRFT